MKETANIITSQGDIKTVVLHVGINQRSKEKRNDYQQICSEVFKKIKRNGVIVNRIDHQQMIVL